MFRRLLLVSAISTIAGCSSVTENFDERINIGPTLAELAPQPMPEIRSEVPVVSTSELIETYKRALQVADNPVIGQKIRLRLADLEVLRAEDTQLSSTELGRFYDDAINLYKGLLEEDLEQGVNPEKREQIRYQLAKAYSLDGRLEESADVLTGLTGAEIARDDYRTEANFRRAELLFSQGNYKQAQQAYQAVIDAGNTSSFYSNSLYMKGWSQFKRGLYDDSIDAFTAVLDYFVEQAGTLGQVAGPSRSLVDDTLRVMSLTFSYIDGARSLVDAYTRLGPREYEYFLYSNLGELYLDQRRYEDSADVYRTFTERYILHPESPNFTVKMIDVFVKGNFPSEILPTKRRYVESYGINSEFWSQASEDQNTELKVQLKPYLKELASYDHAQGQLLKEEFAAVQRGDSDKSRESLTIDIVNAHFLDAAKWYREYSVTFPADSETPSMIFLMGEAYFDATAYPEAYEAYYRAAYDYRDIEDPERAEQAQEAGYSAIISAAEVISDLELASNPELLAAWRENKTNSSLLFSEVYPQDERAPVVLAQAAQELLDRKQYVDALAAAHNLINWPTPIDSDLTKMGWLITAQAQYDTEEYASAETAYRQVLSMPSLPAEEIKSLNTRLAASIYRQAEQKVQDDNLELAVFDLLRIKEVVPGEDIAARGQFDAINYLMELALWQRADDEINVFAKVFPAHELNDALPAKRILVYENLERWADAARVLRKTAEADLGSETSRVSLYLAAEYYQKADDLKASIDTYKAYARAYPEPLDQMTEARYQLTELYKTTGDSVRRDYWLRDLIKGEKDARKKNDGSRTDRVVYLAAYASNERSVINYDKFNDIKLKLPLKKSLQAKKKALNKTLDEQQAIIDYGVAEFVTLANFRIGEIYSNLSQSLMDSEQPKGLSELELEQYQILLEEQAYPFEEQSIEMHELNARRVDSGLYDNWVKQSFKSLRTLLPGRYNKVESVIEVSRDIH